MPTNGEVKCVKCSATGTTSVSGYDLSYPDGWMMFEGRTSLALNRELWLCGNCGKELPPTPNPLHTVGVR